VAGFENDPQSERGSDCPRNFLGISNFEILTKIERVFVHKRLRQLANMPITGDFDVAHLRTIHRDIFQDVFPWAGEFRVVNLSKGDSDFGLAIYIGSALEELLNKLKRESHLKTLPAKEFAVRAAFYLGEINAIHPFREGNGRTQREFIRQLAVQAGHTLSWAGFMQDEMVEASIASHTRGDYRQLTDILVRALEPERTA
jgi:cell filamentation protein